MDGYREALSDTLAKYEKQYGTVKEAEEFGTRFHQLIRHIHDTQGQKVVVIIDEYDTPMMRNLYNEDMLDGLRTMLRGFYQTVKLDGAYLRFVFILGRADVVIKTDTHVFVLELKVDDSVENALAQIDDKEYAIPYETESRTLIKCGANISSEARNITHWRITDADGNIIDEQKF